MDCLHLDMRTDVIQDDTSDAGLSRLRGHCHCMKAATRRPDNRKPVQIEMCQGIGNVTSFYWKRVVLPVRVPATLSAAAVVQRNHTVATSLQMSGNVEEILAVPGQASKAEDRNSGILVRVVPRVRSPLLTGQKEAIPAFVLEADRGAGFRAFMESWRCCHDGSCSGLRSDDGDGLELYPSPMHLLQREKVKIGSRLRGLGIAPASRADYGADPFGRPPGFYSHVD